MSALLSFPENPFRLTLSMCVEYGGHCIMCTAKAPLAKGDRQFMYGSNNAGKKYYLRDKQVAKLMEDLGRNFHLGSHTVFPSELVTNSDNDKEVNENDRNSENEDEDEDELKKASQQPQQEAQQQPSAEKPNEQSATTNVIDPYTHETESTEQEKEEHEAKSEAQVVNTIDPYTHETESTQSNITVNVIISNINTNSNTDNLDNNSENKATKKAKHKITVSVSIVPGVDVELHHAIDGRMYMLDLARFCPSHPYSYDKDNPLFTKECQSYLFRQFRADFMRRFCREFLSSDAFSPFGIVFIIFSFCFILFYFFLTLILYSNFKLHSIETISWNQNKESSGGEYRI